MKESFVYSVMPADNKTIPLIGREETISIIKQHILDNSNNISLIGDTKIGKSSILKTIENIFLDTKYLNRVIPVYLNFEKFAYDITGEIFLDRVLRNIYRTNNVLNNEFKEYSWGKSHEFSEVIEFCKYENIIILLLLDNFDSIPILKKLDNDFWTHLRSNAQEKGLSIVTASRSGLETLCHKGDIVTSHFWNSFNPIINISVFDNHIYSIELLSRGISSDKIKKLILSNVGDHPCFLKIAANTIIQNEFTDSTHELTIVNEIYDNLVPYYDKCWRLLEEDEKNVDNGIHYKLEYLSILNSICSSKIKDTTDKRELTNLKQLGYIHANSDGLLEVSSPLFARYLKEKCKKPVAYIGGKPYIFISYAHADKDEVLNILQKLMDNNFRFWFDEGLTPGNEWREELVEALKNTHTFLVFISRNSIISDYVPKEINYAINNHIKQIIPVYLTKTQLPGKIYIEISHIQAIKKHEDENNFTNRIIAAIDIACKD